MKIFKKKVEGREVLRFQAERQTENEKVNILFEYLWTSSALDDRSTYGMTARALNFVDIPTEPYEELCESLTREERQAVRCIFPERRG